MFEMTKLVSKHVKKYTSQVEIEKLKVEGAERQ